MSSYGDSRLSRFSQYQQSQSPPPEQPQGLLALSISHQTTTYHYQFNNPQNGAANGGGRFHQRISPASHQQRPPKEKFDFDSESENENDNLNGNLYGRGDQHELDSRYDDYEDLSEDIGRRHAAPSKRRIQQQKQKQSTPQQPPTNMSQSHHSSGVFMETDIDTGEVQVVRPTLPQQNDVVRSAKSVGDLVQDSPRRGAGESHNDSFREGVSPSDRDKSKSVNFGRDSHMANNSLSKPRSQHDLRVDKSLERIHVPEWYRDGGDDEEDHHIFRLKSVHDDDDYHDEDSRNARTGAFNRTKSAPPSRKTSTSNINPLDAVRQSRQWALSRAVGAESRASTTVSTASNFKRPSIRLSERDASLRRPKPISTKPLEAIVSGAPERPASPVKTESQRIRTETEVKTSSFSYQKTYESSFSPSGRVLSPQNGKPPQLPVHNYVPEPVFNKPEMTRSRSPVHVPVQQRVASPPGPPTLPKPAKSLSSKSPSPVSQQPSPSPLPQQIRVTSPLGAKNNCSPVGSGGLLVTEEEMRTPSSILISNSNKQRVVSPPQTQLEQQFVDQQFEMMDDHSDDQLMSSASGRRPVLLAGYTEAEQFVENNPIEITPTHPTKSEGSLLGKQSGVVSPRQSITPTQPIPVSLVAEPTPFVMNNKPVTKPFYHQNGHTQHYSQPYSNGYNNRNGYTGLSSRVTDIDDVEPTVTITPSLLPQQADVVVSPPLRGYPASMNSSSITTISPPPLVQQQQQPRQPSYHSPSPAALSVNVTETQSTGYNGKQPSPVQWKTTTVVATDEGSEVVIDTAVQVSTRRSGENASIDTSLSMPPAVVLHPNNGRYGDTISNMTLSSNNPILEPEVEPEVEPPAAETQPETSTKNIQKSSLRASFKKPGKFLAKLWKEPKGKEPGKHESEDPAASMPPPPPPPVEPAVLKEHESVNRPVSMVSSGGSSMDAAPLQESTPMPATSTEKLDKKGNPLRSSFRNLFWRDKAKGLPSSNTTGDVKKEKEQPPVKVGLSKSSHNIAAVAPKEDLNKSQVPDESFQTTINESMTISEMSQSVISESSKAPAKKTGVFSPAKWITGRSPAKPKEPEPEKNGAKENKQTNGKTVNGKSSETATNGHSNGQPEAKDQVNSSRPHAGSYQRRDDVEQMMGDAPTGFKLYQMPDKSAAVQKSAPPPVQAPPSRFGIFSNGGSKMSQQQQPQPTAQQKSPPHHLSTGSVLSSSEQNQQQRLPVDRSYDSISRVSSRFAERERDPDSVSTSSSKSKKSRNIFQAIMQYQEEHDHGPHAYTRHYVPPPSGEAVSWLNKREQVNHIVNTQIAPATTRQSQPGSPISGRSIGGASSRMIASDAFSLSSQVVNNQNETLNRSYHGQTSQYTLPRSEAAPSAPPSGPYSRQMSQASQHSMSTYHAQMAHQQKIRQQGLPPPPARLNPAAPPPPQFNIPPSRPIADLTPPVTCSRTGCGHTVSAEVARKQFHICSSCAASFCSRPCREAHMVGPVGKKRCPLDNVRDLCQRAAKRLETDRLLVALVSQFARMSYLCHGRGYVYAHFSGPERAAAFSAGQLGLHSLALEFHTITHTEAALMRGEPLDEVMELLQAYNPESKLVLCVGVSVTSSAPPRAPSARPSQSGGGIGSAANHVMAWDTAALEDLNSPNGESRVVLRAAKLRLAVPRPGSLRALLLVSAGVAFQNRRGNVQRLREITFANIQAHLKKRGVDLLASHPNVYTRLTQYVAGAQEFPPTGLCIWDDAVGRSLLTLLFPDALPRQDWLRSLHQLGDVEMGLPDPRQLAMGVDV